MIPVVLSLITCEIPIKPLKHLLENNDKGKMILEVVADDTYFSPWESEFVVDSFKKLDTLLRPLAEEWSGVELEFVNGYGVRSYVRDSILNVHRDNPASHIISAIIFVDEYPGKIKWPLDFVDHDKKHHQVTFEFGDMLLYESLCPHAREIPFPGEFYRNMYLHWKPKNWDPTPYSQNKLKYSSIQEALNEN